MRRIFEGVLAVGTAIVDKVLEDVAVRAESTQGRVADKIRRNPGLTEKFPELPGKMGELDFTARAIRSSQDVRKSKLEEMEKKRYEVLNSSSVLEIEKKDKSSNDAGRLAAYKSLMEKAEAEFKATGTLSKKMMEAVDHATINFKVETKKINSAIKKRQPKK